MAIALILLAAATVAQPPEIPGQVQIIMENRAYVIRTFYGAKPLYTFDKDARGKSNCIGICAETWLPLTAPAGARPVGKWTIVKRADGLSQWAYRGKPVYSFALDANSVPSGDGMGGVWHLLPATPAK